MTEEAIQASQTEVEAIKETTSTEATQEVAQDKDTKADPEQAATDEPKELSELEKYKIEAEKRISRQRAAAGQLNQKVLEMQRELAELKTANTPKQEAKEPDINDFDTIDAYRDALSKYTREQAFKEVTAKVTAEQAAAIQAQELDIKRKIYEANATKLAAELPDYQQKVEDFVAYAATFDPNSPSAKAGNEAILECENMAKVIYHLGANPELIDSFMNMPPSKITREIIKLDIELGKTAKSVQTKQPPTPLTPLKGGGKAQKSIYDMNASELVKWAKSKT
jgi:hypothetical protein